MIELKLHGVDAFLAALPHLAREHVDFLLAAFLEELVLLNVFAALASLFSGA